MSTSNKNDKSKSNVCEVSNMVQNIKTADEEENISICANCGKEGANNICNKCNMVKYCNAACKKKHRSKHKKQCERRVAEMHEIELFKQPPPEEDKDCPICFLRMPCFGQAKVYMACCGKIICDGCIHEVQKRGGGRGPSWTVSLL